MRLQYASLAGAQEAGTFHARCNSNGKYQAQLCSTEFEYYQILLAINKEVPCITFAILQPKIKVE